MRAAGQKKAAAFVINLTRKKIRMEQYRKDKPESIQAMFNDIAKNYDKTNAILSFQLHKWWNAQLVEHVINNSSPKSLLDLCCGTGDIALHFLKKTSQKKTVYMLDFSREMLACAKAKADRLLVTPRHKIIYLQEDAHRNSLPKESVECATMAYGIRNVKNPEQCIADVYRVLKPGGTFGILELTQPTNPILNLGHQIYLKGCLPIIGRCLTSNQQAYQYLCNSIHHFIKPKELEAILKKVGFQQTYYRSLTGGIATILIGKKPRS